LIKTLIKIYGMKVGQEVDFFFHYLGLCQSMKNKATNVNLKLIEYKNIYKHENDTEREDFMLI
jgi:hypothetical protein